MPNGFVILMNLVFWGSCAFIAGSALWIIGHAAIEYAMDTLRNWLEG